MYIGSSVHQTPDSQIHWNHRFSFAGLVEDNIPSDLLCQKIPDEGVATKWTEFRSSHIVQRIYEVGGVRTTI